MDEATDNESGDEDSEDESLPLLEAVPVSVTGRRTTKYSLRHSVRHPNVIRVQRSGRASLKGEVM